MNVLFGTALGTAAGTVLLLATGGSLTILPMLVVGALCGSIVGDLVARRSTR